MTAELVPQRSRDLSREVDLVSGGEPREERRGDHGCGNALRDRLVDRPAAFARILDVRRDVVQVAAVLLERRMEQLEEPRADDGAVAPDPRDLLQVELELGVLHDLEALRIRLHQSVLDAVVDHLHEVACSRRADVRIAVLRRERFEDRLEALHRFGIPADHQAEADLETPDPARYARVDEAQLVCLCLAVTSLRVAEVRVAAVDDRVAHAGEADHSELHRSSYISSRWTRATRRPRSFNDA